MAGRAVVLLVGAGDAIGAAVARRFAVGGYAVCVARRDAEKSNGLIRELTAKGQSVRAFSVDTRQEDQVQRLFAEVEKLSRADRRVPLQCGLER